MHPQWTTPGGDFVALSVVSDTPEWSGDKMAADVAAWVADSRTNYGWIVLGMLINGPNTMMCKVFVCAITLEVDNTVSLFILRGL